MPFFKSNYLMTFDNLLSNVNKSVSQKYESAIIFDT